MKRFALFLTVLAFAPAASPSVDASSLVRYYDDGATQVTSPHLDLHGTFMKERLLLNAGFAEDIVTSASSDVKSFASGKIEDDRKEFSGSVGIGLEDGSITWGYIESDEEDYHSKTYSVAAASEFFEKNTTVGVSMAYGDDNIGSAVDKAFNKVSTNNSYSFNISQVLSKLSIVQLVYDFRIESGYLESPYRKARRKNPDGTINPVAETHPETRNRNALAFKYNYYSHKYRLALGTTLRIYDDSWDVKSGTIEEHITKEWSDRISWALELRYYNQTKANFYQDTYTSVSNPFMTGNKTLATYDTILIGLRPLYKFGSVGWFETLDMFLKGEYYIQNFKDHTDVGNVNVTSDDKKLKLTAYVVGLGFNAKF